LATLHIFGDESGTMPLNDHDKPFVAATVSFLDERPVEIDERLFENLRALNAMPFAAIVMPFPGYGKLVKAKYDKMEVMARATRLVTGVSGVYELSLRDIVWSHAMGQAVIHSVLGTIFSSSIDAVQILLDQKSMKADQRSLFTDTLRDIVAIGMAEMLKQINPEWKSRIRFTDRTISVNWSDESEHFESQFGLKLADRLSRKLYRSQISSPVGAETVLTNAGFDDSMMDVTRIITNMDRRIIDNFKRNTGLPEPRDPETE